MTDKTERDELIESLRICAKDCDSYSPDVCGTLIEGIGFIAMRHLLNKAAEALAEQPAASVDVMTMGQRAVATELLQCCESWEPGVRVMGNVKAGDAADLLRWLIDSAGGAKGDGDPGEFGVGIAPNPKARYWQERADFWRGQAIALGYDPEATPQPAEGDGAVAWHIQHEDGLVSLQKPESVDSDMREQAAADGVLIRPLIFGDTRPSAAAAVDDAMVDRAIRAFENEPASHTDDDWDRRCMRAALTAALAQQEPRHD